MNHEIDEVVTLDELAAKVAAKHSGKKDNRSDFEADLIEQFHRYRAEDLIKDDIPSSANLEEKWMLAEVGRKAKNQQRFIKVRLSPGQANLDLGADLDAVVLVCSKAALGTEATSGRITTLGLLTAEDLLLMGAESSINRVNVDKADDELQEGIGTFAPQLRPFVNYAAYLRSTKAAS